MQFYATGLIRALKSPLLPKPERTHSGLSRATAVRRLVHLEATRKLAMGGGRGGIHKAETQAFDALRRGLAI